MKNKTKGVIAGIAGIALLTGGSTFALWSADVPLLGGTITNGDLDVAAIGTLSWQDVSADRTPRAITLADWRMVPGDTLEGTQGLDVVLVGDNLVADLALTDTGSTLPAGVTVEYDVVVGGDVVATALLGQVATIELQSADNTDAAGRVVVGSTLDGVADVNVVVRVTFDADDQDQVLETTTLSGLGVSLTQQTR